MRRADGAADALARLHRLRVRDVVVGLVLVDERQLGAIAAGRLAGSTTTTDGPASPRDRDRLAPIAQPPSTSGRAATSATAPRALTASCDGGEELGLAHHRPSTSASPAIFQIAPPLRSGVDLEAQLIARHDRLAELHLVDAP